MACDLSKEDSRLSDEFAILQEEYEETKQEIRRSQIEFEMDKRAEAIKHGKTLLSKFSLRFYSSEYFNDFSNKQILGDIVWKIEGCF